MVSSPSLSAVYVELQARNKALYADCGKLKKQVREYGIIQKKRDSFLLRRQEQEHERQGVREQVFRWLGVCNRDI